MNLSSPDLEVESGVHPVRLSRRTVRLHVTGSGPEARVWGLDVLEPIPEIGQEAAPSNPVRPAEYIVLGIGILRFGMKATLAQAIARLRARSHPRP